MILLFDLKGVDAREPLFLFYFFIHHQLYESFLFQLQSHIASHIYEGIALVSKQMLKGSCNRGSS